MSTLRGDTNTTPALTDPMPTTLATALTEVRRLRIDLATALIQLREATAYISVIEKERDDAFADADHWREQAGDVSA